MVESRLPDSISFPAMHSERLILKSPLREVRLAPQQPTPPVESLEVERQAYQRGRQEAEKELRVQMIQQRAELGQLQQGVFRCLSNSVLDVRRQSEVMLIDLALEVAVKMVASIPISKELVANRVREALDQADASSEIVVHLHPEDIRLLDQIPPQDQPGAGGLCPVRIAQDSTVERGGCRVLTAFGVIDNQPGTTVRRIREALVAE